MTISELFWVSIGGWAVSGAMLIAVRVLIGRRLDGLRAAGVSAPFKVFGWGPNLAEKFAFFYGGFLKMRDPEVTRLMVGYWMLVLVQCAFVVAFMLAVTAWFMSAGQ
ncbi:hypothetical protein ACIQC9_04230 [Brevundimonas sp. NPDC092305]|uniref:hypothetical protein n=1 Tax=Brevundimonas sp. NPDC092305 TaxID=3363957 RepID=UPI0037F9B96B